MRPDGTVRVVDHTMRPRDRTRAKTHKPKVDALSGPRSKCADHGCQNKTTARKPYCEEHVILNPYARKLVLEIARRGLHRISAEDREAGGI